ncbi:MAG: radical SAM protein [Candidatus Omnitrophica bacterium]|nr:radical SAM protein [Candidatus Omnitrophota bacterium]
MKNIARHCGLCNRKCGVDRLIGEPGACGTGRLMAVHSYQAHPGEEPPISGTMGSGTIFFSHCPMACVYCQNYRFSQEGEGAEVSVTELSGIMLELESRGCHNVNLVSPTHYAHLIVQAIDLARENGLSVPLVYNTGGYDSLRTVLSLKGKVDIYLADMKYSGEREAYEYSGIASYPELNRKAVKAMHEQVGGLVIDNGIATRGLIIRILILPNDIAGVSGTLEFIKKEIGTDVHLSVMSQYYPVYRSGKFAKISRRINEPEYLAVKHKIDELGFLNGWIQPFDPDFDKKLLGETFEPNVKKNKSKI